MKQIAFGSPCQLGWQTPCHILFRSLLVGYNCGSSAVQKISIIILVKRKDSRDHLGRMAGSDGLRAYLPRNVVHTFNPPFDQYSKSCKRNQSKDTRVYNDSFPTPVFVTVGLMDFIHTLTRTPDSSTSFSRQLTLRLLVSDKESQANGTLSRDDRRHHHHLCESTPNLAHPLEALPKREARESRGNRNW